MQGSGKEIGPKGKLITPGLPLSRRDRKKKRFVGQSGQEDKKKIKTESGRYISSSYKRDLYPTGRGRVGRGGFLSSISYKWSRIQGAGPGGAGRLPQRQLLQVEWDPGGGAWPRSCLLELP
jgi:hypothetical protein